MANGRRKSPADKMFNTIVILVILVVLGLGAYAVWGKLGANLQTKKIESGEAEATVQYSADQAGMEVSEYLAQYGLENAGLKGSSTMTEMTDAMTVQQYAEYTGTTADELLAQYSLTDKATADTNWKEAQDMMTVGAMMGGEEGFAQMKEFYGFDDSITAETLWGDAKDVIEQKVKEKQEELANATPAPTAEAESTQTPENAESTEATEVPAATEAAAAE